MPMALKADLYLDRIDISKYLPEENCDKACGFSSCEEWLRKAREGKAKITDCPRLGPSAESISKYLPKEACDKACGFSSCEEWIGAIKEKRAHITQCFKLTPNFVYALEMVLSLDRILPEIEITQHPNQGILGLHEINGAGPESPVLVTGNALATQDVLMAILSTTTAPFYLLFIDCLYFFLLDFFDLFQVLTFVLSKTCAVTVRINHSGRKKQPISGDIGAMSAVHKQYNTVISKCYPTGKDITKPGSFK